MTSSDGAKPQSAGSREAARRQRRIAWTLTLVLVAIYLAFLMLVTFAPDAMAAPVAGTFTAGLLLGAGVIIIALAFAGYYVAQANRNDLENARRP